MWPIPCPSPPGQWDGSVATSLTSNAEEREGALGRSQSHDAVVEGPGIWAPDGIGSFSTTRPIAVGARPYDRGQYARWRLPTAEVGRHRADVSDFRPAR